MNDHDEPIVPFDDDEEFDDEEFDDEEFDDEEFEHDNPFFFDEDEEETPLDEAMSSFIFAGNWHAYQAALREYEALLLSDAALEMLDGMIRVFPDMGAAGAVETMEQHRRMLLRCREIGVDAALAEVREEEALADTPLELAMKAFLDADSVQESREVAEQQADLLLSPEADEWLVAQMGYAREDGDMEVVAWLEQERQVLATMREIGIDAFFEVVDTTMEIIRALPAAFREAMAGDMRGRKAFIRELRPMFKTLEHNDPFRPFLKEMIDILKKGSAADAEEYLQRYEAQWR
jgi:hypothetical protein